jgi:DNA (cytosine-5)-methyltransferase 1
VAGMREGLADPRGALTIKYVELLDAIDHVRTKRGEPEAVASGKTSPASSPTRQRVWLLPRRPGGRIRRTPTARGKMEGRWLCVWTHANSRMAGSGRPIFRPGPTTPPCVRCRKCSSRVRSLEVLFEREGVRRDTPPRRGEGQDVAGRAPFGPALQCGCGLVFGLDLGQYGCPNCEGDEGPAVEVLAGVPAYGGHSLQGWVSARQPR